MKNSSHESPVLEFLSCQVRMNEKRDFDSSQQKSELKASDGKAMYSVIQGNIDTKNDKSFLFKIQEAVQKKVTPIKYHV